MYCGFEQARTATQFIYCWAAAPNLFTAEQRHPIHLLLSSGTQSIYCWAAAPNPFTAEQRHPIHLLLSSGTQSIYCWAVAPKFIYCWAVAPKSIYCWAVAPKFIYCWAAAQSFFAHCKMFYRSLVSLATKTFQKWNCLQQKHYIVFICWDMLLWVQSRKERLGEQNTVVFLKFREHKLLSQKICKIHQRSKSSQTTSIISELYILCGLSGCCPTLEWEILPYMWSVWKRNERYVKAISSASAILLHF